MMRYPNKAKAKKYTKGLNIKTGKIAIKKRKKSGKDIQKIF